jgi:hypothetical protein
MSDIFDAIVENGKQQLSKYVDELIINLDLSTFRNIDKKIQDIIEVDNNTVELYDEIKDMHSIYEKDIKSIKLENENQDKDIDALNNTFIKESYFITDPNNIKKSLGYNDSSIRIGHNNIQDWDGDINSKYKNLKGNIGFGHNVNGSLVPVDKISEISNIRNIAIGIGSLGYNVKGNYNVATGYNALLNNVEGSGNVGVGFGVMFDNLKGSYNTAIGSGSGNNNQGSYNTYVGRYAGRGTPNSTQKWDWTTCVGSGTVATNSHQVILGTDNEHVYTSFPTHIMTSDESFQKNSVVSKVGLDFIDRLEPIEFESATNSNEKEPRKHLGFSAQSVKRVMDELDIDYALYQNHEMTGGLKRETLSYMEFIPAMAKAIQDLNKKNNDLQDRVEALEATINLMKANRNSNGYTSPKVD